MKTNKNSTGISFFERYLSIWVILCMIIGIAYLFFYIIFGDLISPELAKDYLSGAVLLGAAPCTAMVFVWSHLTKGNPAYTLKSKDYNLLIRRIDI